MKKYLFLILPAFIIGIVLTVFTYQAVTVYQLRTQAANDHAVLTQVVDFLNNQLQAAQKASTQTQVQAAQKAPTQTQVQTPTVKMPK